MTQLKDQRKAVCKRLDSLFSIYRSVKDKEARFELGKLIIAKLDELDEYCQSKNLAAGKSENKGKKEKKKKKKEKSKGVNEAHKALKKLEPSKDLFNDSQQPQPGNDETGNQ